MTEASEASREASREVDEFGKSRGSVDLDQINVDYFLRIDLCRRGPTLGGFSDSDGSELATDCTKSVLLNETRGSMESSPKAAVVDGFEETEGVTNKVGIASKNEDFADFPTFFSATPNLITPDTNWVDFGTPVASSVRKVGENEELDFAEFDAYDLEKTPRSQEAKKRILSLWASVRDVVEAKALEHEWETGVVNRNYLTSLEIEDNSPVKEASDVPEATRKPVEVGKAEHEPKKTVIRNSENISEDLSTASAKVLFRLPWISFLWSKTISFPN